MSAPMNNEKSPNLLSAHTNTTNPSIYPTLPPPYTPQAPSVPYGPSVPQAPLAPYPPSVPQAPTVPYTPSGPQAPTVPQAPSAPPLIETKSDDPKPTDKLNSEKDEEEKQPIEFSPKAMKMTCPSCKAEVITRTERHPTLRTHACACCLFWTIWWPCICLPYCLPGCNNVDHFCPNCDSYIGGYKC